MASALAVSSRRRIDFIHLPVPRRATDRYFAPLADLELQPRTQLYLGLVHFRDGLEGTRRRIAHAERVVGDFGIATECGWGRREPATIPGLLALHRDASAPLGARRGTDL
jgi:hypothetical protein